jgi:hypothetical protein
MAFHSARSATAREDLDLRIFNPRPDGSPIRAGMRALRTRHGVEISQAMFLTAGIERLTNETSQNRINDIPRAPGCHRYAKAKTEKLISGWVHVRPSRPAKADQPRLYGPSRASFQATSG